MPQTRSIFDCRRFAESITAAGGQLPSTIGHLLDGAALIDSHNTVPRTATGLLDQMAAGKLTAAKLTAAVETAAREQMIANFTGDLRQAMEPQIVQRWHKELAAGAADEILDSLRDRFDAAADDVRRAKSVIGSGESTLEFVLESAGPELTEVWQALPRALSTLAGITRIAAQFGVRQAAQFSQLTAYGLAANEQIHDYALVATTGGLVGDSVGFSLPDRGRTDSPFYRAHGLRLHTIEQMKQRYTDFCASEFDRLHADRAVESWVDETGHAHQQPQPENPFRAKADA